MADENSSRLLREMERKANDRIRVYNYTDDDFQVLWDSYIFTIPSKNKDTGAGKGQAIVPRYVAQNYVTHFTDAQLTKTKDSAIKAENKRLIDGGNRAMSIDSQERLVFETQYSIGNPEKRSTILAQIWLGVEEEFGLGQRAEDELLPKKDERPMDEVLIEQLERRATPRTEPTPPSESQEEPKAATAEELLNLRKNKLIQENSQ